MFKDHHYLDGSLNKASRCYVAIWGGRVIGFISTMTLPSGSLKNAWRGHRIVILPQFQGMGIGPRLSDTIAQMHIDEGHRFFSRTAHVRLGEYRENSDSWVGTSKNRKLRKDVKHENVFNNHYADNKRICYSHEYIGIKKES
jgi:GNAT superfamily N-acetyltransferase